MHEAINPRGFGVAKLTPKISLEALPDILMD